MTAQVQPIATIGLSNFKCFDQLELHCSKLNLLCGINGSGKSTVIQSLLILGASYRSRAGNNGLLNFLNSHCSLGSVADVLREGSSEYAIGFEIENTHIPGRWSSRAEYEEDSDGRLRPSGAFFGEDSSLLQRMPFEGAQAVVMADRTGPRSFYPSSHDLTHIETDKIELGRRGLLAWDNIRRNQRAPVDQSDPRIPDGHQVQLLGELVDSWLQSISPGSHLNLNEVEDANIVIAGYSFDQSGDVATRPYSADNVGFGLSYTLPVIAALLSEAGTLCLIENPEAHVHPRGQTKLGELAARAAKAGVQIFAETHSDHFMDGVRIAVREGIIKPVDVKFHYFQREGNTATVTTPEIDEDGRLSEWPPGFFDQTELNMAALLAPKGWNA